MALDELKANLPDYAKDLKLNLGSLMNETVLSDQQKYGCLLACAYAVGAPDVVNAASGETAGKLSAEAEFAAKAAAAVMGMNNVYYRSIHIMSSDAYQSMPAKLRMSVIGAPGIEKADFELFSLSVSAVNGCGMCLDAHERELRGHGLTAEQIQAAIRIASVVNAVSRVVTAERSATVSALA